MSVGEQTAEVAPGATGNSRNGLAGLLKLSLAGAALAFLVIVLGAFTRLVDAGLSCPDWPGCYGHLAVPDTAEEMRAAAVRFPDAPLEVGKAWAEMVHRYFAAALGLLILGLAFLAFRRRPHAPLKLPLALVLLVMLQGAFGAWTVTLKLWPQVVTAHLLGGFATLSLLWLLALRLGLGAGHLIPRRLQRLASISLALVVLQVALGGWVTANYAGLACPDFPTCHGAWAPPMNLAEGFNLLQSVGPNYLGGLLDSEARVAIQVAHRLGAAAVLVAVGWLGWRLWAGNRRLALWVLGLLAAQLVLGILNVLLTLPLWAATAHNAGAALLLLALVTVCYRAQRSNVPSRPQNDTSMVLRRGKKRGRS